MAAKDPKKQLVEQVLSYRKHLRQRYMQSSQFQVNHKKTKSASKISLQKGTEFESFVVRRFDPKYFTLIEWRSDKAVDEIFPLMSKFPDLEFYFESGSERNYFAVECKWRENFLEEKLYLDKYQIENYRHYQSCHWAQNLFGDRSRKYSIYAKSRLYYSLKRCDR